jgi:hypothetical protein
MSVYRHYDNSNQVASFYKLPLFITIKWRLYQATEVVPSCVTRGTCIPNMLPGRPISGGSVLNGQVHDAEEALALHFSLVYMYPW